MGLRLCFVYFFVCFCLRSSMGLLNFLSNFIYLFIDLFLYICIFNVIYFFSLFYTVIIYVLYNFSVESTRI